MDRKYLIEISKLLERLLETEPTDKELDYDDDYIQVYADAHSLKESLENIGY